MNHTLAEAVLAVLSSPEPDRAAPLVARFGEQEWRRNLFWLDASGLALHLLHALRLASAEAVLPSNVLARLRQNAADNARRTELLLEDFAAVNRVLEQACIPFAALKGFTLVPEYCAHPSRRHQLDLDYLVAQEQRKALAEAVRSLGYRLVSDRPHEIRFATAPGSLPRHEDTYRPMSCRSLEFHFRLFDRPEFPLHLPDNPLRRARAAACCGVAARVLDAEDQFLHQALHIFQHVLVFNLRLSWLLEIATAVRNRRADAVFWHSVRRRARAADPRIGTILGLVLALTREMFACDVPPALSCWTIDACPPPVLLWVRNYGRRWALRAFPGNKLTLLVTRELMDRGAWRRFARASILPLHRPPRVATADAENGLAMEASRMQRRFVAGRALFHFREGLRLGLAWPGWMLRRLWLPAR